MYNIAVRMYLYERGGILNPIAFSIFGLDVRWYGVIIATGMLIGIIIAKYNCKFREVNYDVLLDTILICFPFSIIGARLYYVLFQFDTYRGNILEMINIRQGGLAIHGGLIFGLLTAVIYTRYKKVNFFKMADVAVPSI